MKSTASIIHAPATLARFLAGLIAAVIAARPQRRRDQRQGDAGA